VETPTEIYKQGLLRIIAEPVQSAEALHLIDLAMVALDLGLDAEKQEGKS
jgi:hypothetical protein